MAKAGKQSAAVAEPPAGPVDLVGYVAAEEQADAASRAEDYSAVELRFAQIVVNADAATETQALELRDIARDLGIPADRIHESIEAVRKYRRLRLLYDRREEFIRRHHEATRAWKAIQRRNEMAEWACYAVKRTAEYDSQAVQDSAYHLSKLPQEHPALFREGPNGVELRVKDATDVVEPSPTRYRVLLLVRDDDYVSAGDRLDLATEFLSRAYGVKLTRREVVDEGGERQGERCQLAKTVTFVVELVATPDVLRPSENLVTSGLDRLTRKPFGISNRDLTAL